jgi:hypothetical protein
MVASSPLCWWEPVSRLLLLRAPSPSCIIVVCVFPWSSALRVRSKLPDTRLFCCVRCLHTRAHREPHGQGSPTFIIDSSIDSHTSHILLGELIDRQLCFYGACSVAVVAPAAAEDSAQQPQQQHRTHQLALAAVATAIRETHRCGRGSLAAGSCWWQWLLASRLAGCQLPGCVAASMALCMLALACVSCTCVCACMWHCSRNQQSSDGLHEISV